MRELGCVVVEFNQASGQPSITAGIYTMNERDLAQQVAEAAARETRAIGRRERYAIATVTIEDDEDEEEPEPTNPCSQCGEETDPDAMYADYGMCASCLHNAIRSGWEPGEADHG
jgi:hypothetical protein